MISLPPHLHLHHHHKNIWYFVFEAAYAALQGVSAKIQAVRIARNLPISHFWWAAGMAVISLVFISALVFSYKKITKCTWKDALKLAGALLLVRFVMFTPWLNLLRGEKFFYLGKSALQDQILAHTYVYFWSAAAAALIGIQFFL